MSDEHVEAAYTEWAGSNVYGRHVHSDSLAFKAGARWAATQHHPAIVVDEILKAVMVDSYVWSTAECKLFIEDAPRQFSPEAFALLREYLPERERA